jgi:hypothetical protein
MNEPVHSPTPVEQTKSPLVFISYSRRDFPFVHDLVQSLRGAGIRVWLDQSDIAGGEPWWKSIRDAIASHDFFIVVVSPYSSKSAEVKREIEYAAQLQKSIVPLLLQTTKAPPESLSALQRIDFRINYDKALRVLLTRLRNAPPNSADDAPEFPHRPIRWFGFVSLTYIVCPRRVKGVSAGLYLSAAFKFMGIFFSALILDEDESALCVFFLVALIFVMWWTFRAANRKATRGEMIAVVLLLGFIPLIGLAFSEPIIFKLLLLLTPLDMASLIAILFSKTYQRWMPAYPSWGK